MRPPDAFASGFLEKKRLRYEQGHKQELLYSLNWCLMNNVEVPPWVKQAFAEANTAALNLQITSWDEAFGPPLPKGKRLATEQRNMRITWPLFWRVRELHEAGRSIDVALFEEVGKEFGVGRTVASELYYEMGKELEEQLAEQEGFQGK